MVVQNTYRMKYAFYLADFIYTTFTPPPPHTHTHTHTHSTQSPSASDQSVQVHQYMFGPLARPPLPGTNAHASGAG